MTIFHCLWIGGLAGLVASRLIRGRDGVAPVASSVAVGILGALLGALAEPWLTQGDGRWPSADLIAAAVGASLTLIAWSLAQRMFLASPAAEKSTDHSSGAVRR